jgi:hypothetical protein
VSSPQDQAPSGDSAPSAGLGGAAGGQALGDGKSRGESAAGGQPPFAAGGQALGDGKSQGQDGKSQGQAAAQPPLAAAGQPSAGKVLAGGSVMFRSAGPLILCWCWAAIGLFTLGDLIVQGHNRGAVLPALVVLVITGLVYACAWRPRVEADSGGLTVQNPLRDYRVPWGAIQGIFLGDSVEVQCSRQPPKGHKTVYCWALYSSRRSRARSSVRADARQRGGRSPVPGYARLPAEARERITQTPAQNIAAELSGMCNQAKAGGQADGVITGRWAWEPLAAILVPGLALALVAVL